MLACLRERLGLLGAESAQHPVRKIHLPARLGTDAQLDPWERIRAGQLDDALDAVVAARAPLAADAQLAGGEGDVVEHDDDMLDVQLVELHRRHDGLAAVVHVGLRLEEEAALPAEGAVRDVALELHAVDLDALGRGDRVDRHESGIVARVLILHPGVAEADDEPLGLAAPGASLLELCEDLHDTHCIHPFLFVQHATAIHEGASP